ncbi:hypothetical protein EYF80_057817 [Liparis tanakae]|uniref:Uncharacterized protein n=1 Tax=Liparis tanakae TaxID=230148 RepID=A0A4Z2EUG7_9TELE|nr:hypothetical protein EYF80_057817 [Liparis tanakae]
MLCTESKAATAVEVIRRRDTGVSWSVSGATEDGEDASPLWSGASGRSGRPSGSPGSPPGGHAEDPSSSGPSSSGPSSSGSSSSGSSSSGPSSSGSSSLLIMWLNSVCFSIATGTRREVRTVTCNCNM